MTRHRTPPADAPRLLNLRLQPGITLPVALAAPRCPVPQAGVDGATWRCGARMPDGACPYHGRPDGWPRSGE